MCINHLIDEDIHKKQLDIVKSRENTNSVFNQWHLRDESKFNEDDGLESQWEMCLKFLSDREFALKEILKLHQFFCLWTNTLKLVEEHLLSFLHYYNLNNQQSEAPLTNMEPKVIKYVLEEIYKSLKKLQAFALQPRFLSQTIFMLSCLWDSWEENNPTIKIEFMYMNNKSFAFF